MLKMSIIKQLSMAFNSAHSSSVISIPVSYCLSSVSQATFNPFVVVVLAIQVPKAQTENSK
jgi:hypothetical protein